MPPTKSSDETLVTTQEDAHAPVSTKEQTENSGECMDLETAGYRELNNNEALNKHQKELDALSFNAKITLATRILIQCPDEELSNFRQMISSLKPPQGSFNSYLVNASFVNAFILSFNDPKELLASINDDKLHHILYQFSALVAEALTNAQKKNPLLLDNLAINLSLTDRDLLAKKLRVLSFPEAFKTDLGTLFALRRSIDNDLLGEKPESFFLTRDFKQQLCNAHPHMFAHIEEDKIMEIASKIALSAESSKIKEKISTSNLALTNQITKAIRVAEEVNILINQPLKFLKKEQNFDELNEFSLVRDTLLKDKTSEIARKLVDLCKKNTIRSNVIHNTLKPLRGSILGNSPISTIEKELGRIMGEEADAARVKKLNPDSEAMVASAQASKGVNMESKVNSNGKAPDEASETPAPAAASPKNSQPASLPVVEAQEAPAQVAASPKNSQPASLPVVEAQETPAPAAASPKNSQPASTPAVEAQEAPAQVAASPKNSQPASTPVVEAQEAPAQVAASPKNSQPASTPVVEAQEAPAQVAASPKNSQPASTPVVEAQEAPAQVAASPKNSQPASTPVVEAQETPAPAAASPKNSQPASLPVEANDTPAMHPAGKHPKHDFSRVQYFLTHFFHKSTKTHPQAPKNTPSVNSDSNQDQEDNKKQSCFSKFRLGC